MREDLAARDGRDHPVGQREAVPQRRDQARRPRDVGNHLGPRGDAVVADPKVGLFCRQLPQALALARLLRRQATQGARRAGRWAVAAVFLQLLGGRDRPFAVGLRQPRERRLAALLGLDPHGLDLLGDPAREGHHAREGQDHERRELPADDQEQGEDGQAPDVVGHAPAEEERRARGGADGADGGRAGGGVARARGVGAGHAGRVVQRPHEALVEVDVLQAGLVETQVGLARLEEVREVARVGLADGELEGRWACGRGWIGGFGGEGYVGGEFILGLIMVFGK